MSRSSLRKAATRRQHRIDDGPPESVHQLDSVLDVVRSHEDDLLLVLIGFDGVLTEYQADPAAVYLADARRELLRHLMDQPRTVVALTSGRRVRDLRKRVRLGSDAFYVGLHGLEVVGPDFALVQQQIVEQFSDPLRGIARALEQSTASVPGVRVENKDGAVALHTREADARDAVWARFHLLNHAADLVNRQAVRVFRGNQVFELLPNVGHMRAEAVRSIRDLLEHRHRRRVFSVYVAEDAVDDDTAEAVDGHGVVAVVGRRGGDHHLHLDSTATVEHLIARLIARGGRPVS